MGLGICQCTYLGFWYNPSSGVFTTLQFLMISLFSAMGFIVNYKFRKKLKQEKRQRPLGRKGNVIEPLMSLYCIILMFGTPYCLLVHWQFANEVIPSHLIPEWLCILLTKLERCISFIGVYNSLFVALIRYVYIVHQKRSNEWDFERVGRRFQLASVMIPLCMETIHYISKQLSSNTYGTRINIERAKSKVAGCSELYNVSNSTYGLQDSADLHLEQFDSSHVSQDVAIVAYYIYVTISGLVSLNIMEGFFYIKIFICIKRLVWRYSLIDVALLRFE